jgi:hypothetical protein
MKTINSKIVLFLFFAGISFAQINVQYYRFSELRGMEDSTGVTHLFYRIHSEFAYPSNPPDQSYTNNIFHFIPGKDIDTMFLSDFSTIPPAGSSNTVYDFTFWHNNPNLCLLAEMVCHFDCRMNLVSPQTSTTVFSFGPSKLAISKTNDSAVYVLGASSYFSIDGAKTWLYKTFSFTPYSVSPLHGNVLFGLQNNKPVISEDTGKTTSVIADDYAYSSVSFYYDEDGKHTYMVAGTDNGYILKGSDNEGKAGSWTTLHYSLYPIFVNIDPQRSGRIWLADQNAISFSDNFGQTFVPFKTVDKSITGFYAKAGVDTVYATTKWQLYQITGDGSKALKSLPFTPDAKEWYPLVKGWQWNYVERDYSDSPSPFSDTTLTIREITGDTTIAGNKYAINKFSYISRSNPTTTGWSYQRFDSTTCMVYQSSSGTDLPLLDLLLEPGDTSKNCTPFDYMVSGQTTSTLFGLSVLMNSCHQVNSIPGVVYSYAKGVGLVAEGSEELGSGYQKNLVGFIKEGVAYGNVSGVLAVNDKLKLPFRYRLEQNYPNPFNPATTISYETGARNKVTLKVFSIIGKEITTLVNEEKPAGKYSVRFDGTRLPSGVYIINFSAGQFSTRRKMILLK